MIRSLQYAFIAIIVTTVGFSLYQWNASRASTQKTAPNNGLIGYWSFDEGTGTQAGDASGNGNTGTLTNGPTWTDGKFGKAINFDGVDDYVNISNPSLGNTYTFSAWIRVSTYAGAPIQFPVFGEYTGGGDTKNYIYISTGGQHLGFDQYLPSSGMAVGSTTINTGVWYFVTATQTATNQRNLYVNGVLDATANEVYSGGVPVAWTIGKRADSSAYHFNGQIDEVRIYNRALSGTEITNLYNLGAEKLNVSPVSNLTSGLVGYWTFDGKDTPWSSSSAGTATDRSGNSNTGTLTNMSQSTSVMRGKLGQALNFDGVDDKVTVSSDVIGSGATSICVWINPRSMGGAGYGRIVKSMQAGSTKTNLLLSYPAPLVAFSSNDSGYIATSAITYNRWTHICATRDASGNGTIYMDGLANVTGSTGTPSSGATATHIGNTGDSSRTFDGLIDDVRIYNRQISASEVQSLYDLGASDKVNSSVSQNQGTGRLDSGLAGYWKLDDASGTTATDSSTNANNGTLTNGPTWGTGRIGSALSFNGTSQYVSMASNTAIQASNDVSITAWVNPVTLADGASYTIFSTGNSSGYGWTFSLQNQVTAHGWNMLVRFLSQNSPNNVFVANQWSFFSVTYDHQNVRFYVNGVLVGTSAYAGSWTPGTYSTIGVYTTNFPGSYMNGSIDEVRVYNRALSADEVSQLYRLTAPTAVDTSLKGYWSFDGSATNWTSSSTGTASDLSGSGNTGTMTNMSQSTSVMRGKLGQGLKFDGVDDYVDLGNSASLRPTGSMSLCAWAPMYHSGGVFNIISNDGNSGARGYALYEYSINGTLDAFAFSIAANSTTGYAVASTSRTGTNGGVFHVCGVYDAPGQTTQIYVNGTLEGTKTSADGIPASQYNQSAFGNPKIGNRGQLNGNYFSGTLDEVRLYARALSATEVTALYNSGR